MVWGLWVIYCCVTTDVLSFGSDHKPKCLILYNPPILGHQGSLKPKPSSTPTTLIFCLLSLLSPFPSLLSDPYLFIFLSLNSCPLLPPPPPHFLPLTSLLIPVPFLPLHPWLPFSFPDSLLLPTTHSLCQCFIGSHSSVVLCHLWQGFINQGPCDLPTPLTLNANEWENSPQTKGGTVQVSDVINFTPIQSLGAWTVAKYTALGHKLRSYTQTYYQTSRVYSYLRLSN